MKTFYITTAANHPGGSGYWEVHGCLTEEQARIRTVEALGQKWAFIYEELDQIHPLDRKCHGRIG